MPRGAGTPYALQPPAAAHSFAGPPYIAGRGTALHRGSWNCPASRAVLASNAMLPATCVVVPTYWTRSGGAFRSGDALYDHPTPVDGHTTLTALLDSLRQLRGPNFLLLVLVAVTGDDVGDQAEDRVLSVLSAYPDIVSLAFGPSRVRWLHDWLERQGSMEGSRYLQLREYPRIRNLQLALPHALHCDSIVALDDDEIVTDPDFLKKAIEPLGSRVDGKVVDGLSGHYLQDNGGILLEVDETSAGSPNIFDRKAVIMNSATAMLEAKPGNLVQTPFCFGGNMEFSSELAATVGFDPGITRGEDIDYLLNARMEGKHFFLRKDLRILHQPPRGGSYRDTTSTKLAQDIVRFLYERTKIAASQDTPGLHEVTVEELRPYPGDFLAHDISGDAREALVHAGYRGDPVEFLQTVESENRVRLANFLEFRQKWPRLQELFHGGIEVRDTLGREVRGA
jgi:hypothetical protein